MKFTDRHDSTASPPPSGYEFDQARESQQSRLRTEKTHLTSLAAALTRVEGSPLGIFFALQTLAHRIRGTATIIEAPKLSSAASALERASATACANCSSNVDEAVWSALEDLINQMATTCAGDFDKACEILPSPLLHQVAHPLEKPLKKRVREEHHRQSGRTPPRS